MLEIGTMGLKTIVADNQLMFVDGLTAFLERVRKPAIQIVGKVETAEELLNESEAGEIDLIIMDVDLPDTDGLELISTLRDKYEDVKICVLTSVCEPKCIREAFRRGANGYILKYNEMGDLIEGILDMMDGYNFVADGLRITPASGKAGTRRKTTRRSRSFMSYDERFVIKQKLTNRERQILDLITQAKSNKEIATMLFISEHTVSVHKKNAMRKLGVKSTANLIKLALENKLV